jgi:hypothetical protein
MTVTIDAQDPRSIHAVEIAAGAGQWLKCRTADGEVAWGVPSQCPQKPGRYYLVTGAGRLAQPFVVETDIREVDLNEDVDPRRLVEIDGKLWVLDIRFRMLKNKELARAMGFDDEEQRYEFSGTQTQITKQIGNAVSVRTAAALVGAILGPYAANKEKVA